MTDQRLKQQFPTQGWQQFITTKKSLLAAYNLAKERVKDHKIETEHGNVAEAEFRKWLSDFLPKRYSVTSGYIVSTGIPHDQKLPHFDVIIYDQLETPILWIEENRDKSSQGRSMAIPVENVLSVIEVKSRFTTKSVTDALEHLDELRVLMSDIDEDTNPYKVYLPKNFSCGVIFFDLYKTDAFSDTALDKILTYYTSARGFFGGIILHREGSDERPTGRINFIGGDTLLAGNVGKDENKTSLMNVSYSNPIKTSDNIYVNAMLYWAEMEFARFGFDLLAMLKGTFRGNMLSSFYGVGSSHTESENFD